MFSDKDVLPNRAKTTNKNKRTEKIKKEERYRKIKQPIYSAIADLGLLRTFRKQADTLKNFSTQLQINGHADYRIKFLSEAVFFISMASQRSPYRQNSRQMSTNIRAQ